MNPSIKQIWINALRSGRYEQGQSSLHENGQFCCLGVLTDLFIRETDQQWEEYSGNCFAFEDEANFLSPTVQRWSGLDASPRVNGVLLSTMNDAGASFEEIASLIEEHL